MRIFIAIEASGGVRSRAMALIERLKGVDAKVTWVQPEQMHWTLKFLGDIDLTRSPEICQRVSEAVASLAPFDLQVGGLGAFPNVHRPRTIWLGTSEGEGPLAVVRQAVEQSLVPLGFAPEGRRFTPHLTIGRVRSQRNIVALGQLIQQQADVVAGQVEVDEIVTVASTLERNGPIYEILGYSPLQGPVDE